MRKISALILVLLSVLNVRAQYPLVSISDIQYVDFQNLSNGIDTSSYFGDTVEIEGIVTFDPCDYGLSSTGSRVGTWLQDPNQSSWNGIHVLIDAAAIGYSGTLSELNNAVQFIDNFQVGNKVRCTGIVGNFGLNSSTPVPGNTQVLLLPIASEITGIGSVPSPYIINVDQFMLSDGQGGQITQHTTGEVWEGCYAEIPNVQVVDVSYGTGSNTGRIFWSIQDQFGNKMGVRDVSGWIRNDTFDNFCTSIGSNTPDTWDISPYIGATVSYVRGQILEYCSSNSGCQYYISPRDFNDIGPITAAPPVVSNVTLSNSVPGTSQSQTVSATITDVDGSVAIAKLYYSIGLGNTTFTSVSMTQSGNTWSGTIPAQGPDSTYVNYWIKATDNLGYSTNYPDSLATNSFYWVKNDGINSVKDIQYNPSGSATPFLAGKWLTNMDLQGIVMATVGFYDLGLTILQDGEGAWHGIYLRGQNLSTLKRGDKIKITSAKVFENFNVTFLDSTTYLLLSTGNPLYAPYMGLDPAAIHDAVFDQTEPYEGLLIGFNNMFVVNQNPDDPSTFGEWAVDINTTDNIGMRCDDYSNDIGFDFGLDSLSLNQSLDYIYGILYYSFGNWKLLPRNKDDIAGYQTISGIENDPLNLLEVKAYPNPAKDVMHVAISLTQSQQVTISLHDLTGRKVISESVKLTTGENQLTLSSTGVPAGVYMLTISSDQFSFAEKMVVVK